MASGSGCWVDPVDAAGLMKCDRFFTPALTPRFIGRLEGKTPDRTFLSWEEINERFLVLRSEKKQFSENSNKNFSAAETANSRFVCVCSAWQNVCRRWRSLCVGVQWHDGGRGGDGVCGVGGERQEQHLPGRHLPGLHPLRGPQEGLRQPGEKLQPLCLGTARR